MNIFELSRAEMVIIPTNYFRHSHLYMYIYIGLWRIQGNPRRLTI